MSADEKVDDLTPEQLAELDGDPHSDQAFAAAFPVDMAHVVVCGGLLQLWVSERLAALLLQALSKHFEAKARAPAPDEVSQAEAAAFEKLKAEGRKPN